VRMRCAKGQKYTLRKEADSCSYSYKKTYYYVNNVHVAKQSLVGSDSEIEAILLEEVMSTGQEVELNVACF
jgi:hypothetical protein